MILSVLSLLGDILGGLNQLATTVHSTLTKLLPFLRHAPSYENLSISLHLRIKDAAGQRAELERRQEVRFATAEAGVVRDLVWGDGDVLKGYVVSGATLLGVRREGSKSAMLLSLANPPARGERALIRTTRLIHGALSRHQEYLEAQLERPTRKLLLKVSFPKGRPPKRAWITSAPPQGASLPLALRLAADGKAFVEWRATKPTTWATYRLGWSW